MTDSGGKLDDITARIKNVLTSVEGSVDAVGLQRRIRETVGRVASDVDTDAIGTRVKGVVGQVEGKVDSNRLKDLAAEVDRDRVKGWLEEAQKRGAGAASLIGTQGEKLVGRAPGAFDKLASVARETLRSLKSDSQLLSEGQVERLKGQIKETLTTAWEVTKSGATNAAATVKAKADEQTHRG